MLQIVRHSAHPGTKLPGALIARSKYRMVELNNAGVAVPVGKIPCSAQWFEHQTTAVEGIFSSSKARSEFYAAIMHE